MKKQNLLFLCLTFTTACADPNEPSNNDTDSAILAQISSRGPKYTLFESGQVRPIALSPNKRTLFVANTPDNKLEIYDVNDSHRALSHRSSISVGLEPVAIAVRSDNEVWVVNHVSDSVSIVRLDGGRARVVRTLLVGDEPATSCSPAAAAAAPSSPRRTAASTGRATPS
jgi:DNA-binding beta-propeller fold protein YncE